MRADEFADHLAQMRREGRFDVPVSGEFDDFLGGEGRGEAVPGFARGDLSFPNFGPRGTLVKLHNEESIVPKSRKAEAAQAWGGNGGTSVAVIVLPHGGTVRDVLAALPKEARRNESQFGAKLQAALAPYGVR